MQGLSLLHAPPPGQQRKNKKESKSKKKSTLGHILDAFDHGKTNGQFYLFLGVYHTIPPKTILVKQLYFF